MKTIALCFNLPELSYGGWRSKSSCKKYPGAGWMPHMADTNDFHAMSGWEALKAIAYDGLNPKDVLVVQEEENDHGQMLLQMGADPTVVTCFESPLYTPGFYDRLPEWKAKFKNSLLFSGGTHRLTFPNFEEEDIRPLVPWEDRKPLCAVVANKHYSMLPPSESPSFKQAIKDQLHDARYSAFNHFKLAGLLDLYGQGWGDGYGISVANKIDTMRGYKYALCFENVSQPGYITEKIIDCFVAGVIPIYMGAPDIADHISKWSIEGQPYFDVRGEGIDGVEKWMDRLNTTHAHHVQPKLEAGRAFLKEERGKLHSNKGFAENLIKIIKDSVVP